MAVTPFQLIEPFSMDSFNSRISEINTMFGGLGNEYVWSKTRTDVMPAYTDEEEVAGATSTKRVVRISSTDTIYIADAVSVSENGAVSLVNPETVAIPSSGDIKTKTEKIIGKYFIINGDNVSQFWSGALYRNTVYRCSSDATIIQVSDGSNYFYAVNGGLFKIIGHESASKLNFYGYVNSPDPNAYPPSVSDGYTYTPLGQFGDKVKIELVSYVGTNTYGETNPNVLTFDFKPKFLWFIGQSPVSNIQPFSPATPYGNFYTWLAMEILPTTPTNRVGFGNPNNVRGWRSADGKTLTWFNTSSESDQLNNSTTRYYYIAIG